MADLIELGAHLGTLLLGAATTISAYRAGRRKRGRAEHHLSRDVAPPSQRSGRPRILLVEDVADYRRVLVRLLEFAGRDVDAAATCEQARGLAASRCYAIVIADQSLPDGSGSDLLAELRGSARCRACGLPPRTILHSGMLSGDQAREMREAGIADLVFDKTGDMDPLLAGVAELLGERAAP